MNKNKHTDIAIESRSLFSELVMLTKFRLSAFVVISSVLSYLIVAQGNISWPIITLLALGGICITGAANVLNQILERDYDKHMKRTQDRPLAAERLKLSAAVLFAGLLLLSGSIFLALINPLTVMISMVSLILYAFVYTPLKRYSTLAVGVGAIPGALPVLIGTTAYSGTLTTIGLILFGIQFLWQFPHFWSIGYLAFDDYKKAGYKLLPTDGAGNINKNLGYHSFVYSLVLIVVSAIPFFMGSMGLLPFILVMIIGVLYAGACIRFQFNNSRKTALTLMFSSFFYLPLVLSFFLI